jgi:hypothetical protein
VEGEPAWSGEALWKAVERLALPEGEGLAYLRALGTYPSLDELALTFDEELLRVRDSLPSDHPLLELDRKLQEMSGKDKAELWMPEALDREPWNTVRMIAQAALAELRQQPR